MRIIAGSLFIYRVFDIAEEIDLKKVESIVRSRESGDTRVNIAPSKPKAVIVKDAPLRVQIGTVSLPVFEGTRSFEITATIWNYGAISISFQGQMDSIAWSSLLGTAAALSSETDLAAKIDAEANRRCQELAKLISAAVIRPALSRVSEDYVIYSLRELEGVTRGEELLERADLPALLLGEDRETLSPRSSEGILQNVYQYGERDLVVIDWNSAVVFEADGGRDIIDVLEFVLTQMLELRYYDELLDIRLKEVYDAIEVGRQKLWPSPFDRIAKEANTRYMEFSEFMERIDNSLKVVGDFYLAVIYRGAVRRFRLPDWQQSISRKMNVLARVSELLQGEVNVRRSHSLEMIVIALIAFEILSAFFKAGH